MFKCVNTERRALGATFGTRTMALLWTRVSRRNVRTAYKLNKTYRILENHRVNVDINEG